MHTKQDCRPASPMRLTSGWREQLPEQLPVIAMHWTMLQKANTIGKYAVENGTAATIKKFEASHDIGEQK